MLSFKNQNTRSIYFMSVVYILSFYSFNTAYLLLVIEVQKAPQGIAISVSAALITPSTRMSNEKLFKIEMLNFFRYRYYYRYSLLIAASGFW